MTKKRFSFNVNKNQFEYDNKYYAFCNVIDANKIVNQLNALLIEKRMLELEIEKLEVIIKTGNCSLLQKENEQLKSDIMAIEKRADKVYDENEQLKKENQMLNQRLIESDDLKWVREHTVWEQMPTRVKTYTKTSLNGDDDD